MRQIIIHVYYMYTLPGKRGTDRVQWHYMYTMSCMSFENDNTMRKVIIQTNLVLNSLSVISVQSNLY